LVKAASCLPLERMCSKGETALNVSYQETQDTTLPNISCRYVVPVN